MQGSHIDPLCLFTSYDVNRRPGRITLYSGLCRKPELGVQKGRQSPSIITFGSFG